LYAKSYRDFLKPYTELPGGISSHDTFRRVFFILSPDVLHQCLNNYGKDIIGLLAEKQICPDGKKLGAYHRRNGATKVCTLLMHGYRKTGCVPDRRKWKTGVMK
jgi:hypothetical protein